MCVCVCPHACAHPPTFEGPLEYIRIMFSAPCLTLSSMSFCLFSAARRLLLVHILASLLGVSGVKGQSEQRHINIYVISLRLVRSLTQNVLLVLKYK